MRFAELAEASRRLAATSGRKEKVSLIADLLRRAEPDEIEATVAFLSGSVRQARLGLGVSALRAATAAAGASSDEAAAGATGLSVADVDRALEELASLSGKGSAGARSAALTALLRRGSAAERDYLAHLVLGEVRQGALAGLVEEAIARAASLPLEDVRRAAMLSGDLLAVARAARLEGAAGLARFHLQIFRPVQPMLAQTAEDLDEALESGGETALEYKLDGARVQVHKSGEDVRVFSRLLNDVTVAVPELVTAVRLLQPRELILDGEVLALRADGTPHPFQVTMRRFGRKADSEAVRAELPLTPFFFDALRVDSDDLIDRPLRERAEALREAARGLVVPRLLTADPAQASAFFDAALAAGHEGLMAKAPGSLYAAGRRGAEWLKLKPAHTLDLVVLAVEPGSGRRQGWLSNLHLGARDPAAGPGAFAMVGKTFKGMTDAMLAWQTQRLQELAVATDGFVVHVRPELVVEVAFNDVQESPRYASGVALRFARVKRYREDKRAEDADTIETIRNILHGRVRKSRG